MVRTRHVRLSDAVALRERYRPSFAHHASTSVFYQDVEKVVRINPLNTPFGLADLGGRRAVARYRASAENRQQNDVLELRR